MHTKEPSAGGFAPLSPVTITRFAPDLLCLSVTNGRFQPVNSWIVGQGPRAIFDASFPEGAVLEAYESLVPLGDLAGLEALVLTHFHRDHCGQMRALQDRFQIPVFMTQPEWDILGRIDATPAAQVRQELGRFLQAFGLSQAEAAQWAPISYSDLQLPRQSPSFLTQDQTIALGGQEWQVITGGGHSPCAASFLSKDGRYFIAGDQILSGSGPQITLWQAFGADPLGDYLAYLDRLAVIEEACLVLPGHGAPFTHLAARVAHIRQGHLRRLDRLVDLIGQGPCDGARLMAGLYPKEAPKMFGVVLFGMTMALVSHLAAKRQLRVLTEPSGRWIFERA